MANRFALRLGAQALHLIYHSGTNEELHHPTCCFENLQGKQADLMETPTTLRRGQARPSMHTYIGTYPQRASSELSRFTHLDRSTAGPNQRNQEPISPPAFDEHHGPISTQTSLRLTGQQLPPPKNNQSRSFWLHAGCQLPAGPDGMYNQRVGQIESHCRYLP